MEESESRVCLKWILSTAYPAPAERRGIVMLSRLFFMFQFPPYRPDDVTHDGTATTRSTNRDSLSDGSLSSRSR